MRPNLSNRALGSDSIAAEKRLRQQQGINYALGSTLIPDFNEEARANQVFPIKLTNIGETDKVIALAIGDLLTVQEVKDVAGVTIDAIAKEGIVITDAVTCSTKGGTSIDYLQRFVRRNPTRIMRIQFKVSAEEQLNEPLIFQHISPFARMAEQVLNPSAYTKETNNNSKLVTVSPKDLQLDDQTIVYVNLLAGATLNISLTVGAVSNNAIRLAEQAEIVYSGQ